MVGRRPNVLFVVADQERERSWLPPSVRSPRFEELKALEAKELVGP